MNNNNITGSAEEQEPLLPVIVSSQSNNTAKSLPEKLYEILDMPLGIINVVGEGASNFIGYTTFMIAFLKNLIRLINENKDDNDPRWVIITAFLFAISTSLLMAYAHYLQNNVESKENIENDELQLQTDEDVATDSATEEDKEQDFLHHEDLPSQRLKLTRPTSLELHSVTSMPRADIDKSVEILETVSKSSEKDDPLKKFWIKVVTLGAFMAETLDASSALISMLQTWLKNLSPGLNLLMQLTTLGLGGVVAVPTTASLYIVVRKYFFDTDMRLPHWIHQLINTSVVIKVFLDASSNAMFINLLGDLLAEDETLSWMFHASITAVAVPLALSFALPNGQAEKLLINPGKTWKPRAFEWKNAIKSGCIFWQMILSPSQNAVNLLLYFSGSPKWIPVILGAEAVVTLKSTVRRIVEMDMVDRDGVNPLNVEKQSVIRFSKPAEAGLTTLTRISSSPIAVPTTSSDLTPPPSPIYVGRPGRQPTFFQMLEVQGGFNAEMVQAQSAASSSSSSDSDWELTLLADGVAAEGSDSDVFRLDR